MNDLKHRKRIFNLGKEISSLISSNAEETGGISNPDDFLAILSVVVTEEYNKLLAGFKDVHGSEYKGYFGEDLRKTLDVVDITFKDLLKSLAKHTATEIMPLCRKVFIDGNFETIKKVADDMKTRYPEVGDEVDETLSKIRKDMNEENDAR